MKHIFTALLSLMAGSAFAAPSPLFFNAGTITDPIPIDATAFVNIGTFNIFTSLPYDTQNTLYFTNRGSLLGGVGYRFDTVTENSRKPAVSFVNESSGVIDTTSFGFFGGPIVGQPIFGGFFGDDASYILVSATNITSHGTLSVDNPGLLRLTGKNVDLARGALVAGDPFTGGGGGGGFFFNTNLYFNPSGVSDIYGGAGMQTNNLESDFGLIPPDAVFSPVHLVITSRGFTNFVDLPQSFGAEFAAFANMEEQGTNKIIQVVFVNTNFGIENITADVTFSPFRQQSNPSVPNAPEVNGLPESAVFVQFSAPSFDPITGTPQINAITLVDSSAQQTNIVLYTNIAVATAIRASSYEIFTSAVGFGFPGNTPYTPDLIYPGSTYESNIVIGAYGAISVQVGSDPTVLTTTVDPTNQAPRIEITADKLDLSMTRMRSEGPIILNGKHVAGRGPIAISAGLIEANLGSTNGSLVISNFFPQNFERLRGSISAYSFVWHNLETNDVSTNSIKFHILIVDHALVANITPLIAALTLRSTNLVIKDDLQLTRKVRIEAENLTIDSVITLAGDAINFHATNFIGIKNLIVTTNGVLQGANDAFFGYDTTGYNSVINRGVITAVAPFFKANTFENSGTITAFNGSVLISANTATLSNGSILSDRDVYISAGDLIASNSTITAGQPGFLGNVQLGRLVLNVTNSVNDFGVGASNVWQVTEGIRLERKPLRGNLLGTEIHTIASSFQESQNVWAGTDFGADPRGFTDNAAVGHLILDVRSTNSILRFSGAGTQNALYVLRLDFNTAPSVDINTSLTTLLSIDSNIRIYYVESNAGDKLMTAFPGQIIQVPDPGIVGGVSPLVVKAKGLGVITPNLDGKHLKVGTTYRMRATPGKGHIFAGWTGGTNASSASLTFKMRRNLVLEANFPPNPFDPVAGVYNGLFFDSAGVKHETSGFINFSVTKSGVVFGKLTSGKGHPFRGTFNSSGHALISVVRPGSSTLVLNLQIDLADNSDQVEGTVSDGNWTATVTGYRAVSSSTRTGSYTMVIAGPNSSTLGVGTLTVDFAGRLKLTGTLADGTKTKISQQVNISKDGKWPLYVPLYQGKGSLLSWITFTGGLPNNLEGTVSWTKAGASQPIPNLTVLGSVYTRPAQGASPLAFANGTVTLSAGDLSVPITNPAAIQSASILTPGPNSLSLFINPITGAVSGRFVHPATQKFTVIKGVVLQQQNSARGFFVGPTQNGTVLLQDN